ncbi:MAG: serine/threonine-protein kinase [Byssovorax sp.]
MPDPVGLQVGSVFATDFRVLSSLAGGGMGSVYVVEQLSTGQRRALKLMHPHLVQDAQLRGRFEREARVGARIESDHVVQVIAAGVDGDAGIPWIAMELLEGESLAAHGARCGALPVAEVAEIVRQLGHALGAAHEASVVHRDLKPENIFISAGRRSGSKLLVKVLDFGIAKVAAEANPNATAPMGTLAWMAPEQTEVGAAITPAADVWSLGLLAFWMLTGKSYWRAMNEGAGPSAARLVRELLIEPLAGASARAEALGVPGKLVPSFDEWFALCVARDPAARFEDGGDACAALGPILDEALASAPEQHTAPLSPIVPRPAPSSGDRRQITPPRSTPGAAPPARDISLTRTAPAAAILAAETRTASARPPERRAPRWIGALALGVLGIGALVRFGTAGEPVAPIAVPAPSAPAPPAPIVITDLPPPRSASPEARAAYKLALQSLRDANWGQARAGLQEALRHDPSLAAAHLRLAMTTDFYDLPELRSQYALAVQGRAGLDAREQALLRAIEPLCVEDPPNNAACRERLQALAEESPLDAELSMLAGNLCAAGGSAEDDLEPLFRAVALDPQYADAWSVLAIRLTSLNRLDEATEAANRCLAVSPTSSDCLTLRADVHARRGRCAEMESDLARSLRTGATPLTWTYEGWVTALFALDRPPEVILETQRQKWPLVPESTRAAVEAIDRAEIDIVEGRFLDAEAKLLAGLQTLHGEPGELMHSSLTSHLIGIYREMGKLDRAAAVAADYLKRRDAWQGLPELDRSLGMLRTMNRGGLLSDEELGKRRDAWLEKRRSRGSRLSPWDEWNLQHFHDGDAREMAQAVADLPLAAGPPPNDLLSKIGKSYLVAGMPDKALPHLRAATQPCRRPEPELDLLLADALDGTGDHAASCPIYTKIVERWGKAKPRSITAEKAKAKAKTACPPGGPGGQR